MALNPRQTLSADAVHVARYQRKMVIDYGRLTILIGPLLEIGFVKATTVTEESLVYAVNVFSYSLLYLLGT